VDDIAGHQDVGILAEIFQLGVGIPEGLPEEAEVFRDAGEAITVLDYVIDRLRHAKEALSKKDDINFSSVCTADWYHSGDGPRSGVTGLRPSGKKFSKILPKKPQQYAFLSEATKGL
jgi:hypothetical protein